jgi:hypothetical protein
MFECHRYLLDGARGLARVAKASQGDSPVLKQQTLRPLLEFRAVSVRLTTIAPGNRSVGVLSIKHRLFLFGSRTQKACLRKKRKGKGAKVDPSLDMTFPASDARGAATGTEPPSRPVGRKAPVITEEQIEQARRGEGHKRAKTPCCYSRKALRSSS